MNEFQSEYSDFDPKTQIADIWSVENVQDKRPYLTNEQSLHVLRSIRDASEEGISFITIGYMADDMYPMEEVVSILLENFREKVRPSFDLGFKGGLTDDEFEMMIGYMEGSGYAPIVCNGNLYRLDTEEYEELQEYSIVDVLRFVIDTNGELMDETSDRINNVEMDKKKYRTEVCYLKELEDDDKMLDVIWGKRIGV